MTGKFEATVHIKNKLGLHVRPATCLAQLLHASQSKVTLTYKGESVNARSIMGMIMLSAPQDATLELNVEGEDAEETFQKVLHAFETQFEEGS